MRSLWRLTSCFLLHEERNTNKFVQWVDRNFGFKTVINLVFDNHPQYFGQPVSIFLNSMTAPPKSFCILTWVP